MFKNQKELYEEIKNKIIEECKNSKFGLTLMDENLYLLQNSKNGMNKIYFVA